MTGLPGNRDAGFFAKTIDFIFLLWYNNTITTRGGFSLLHTLTIGKNDAGQRLDKFLSKNFKTMPPALMYKYIRLKKIKVNRKRAEQKQVLLEGDTVELFIKEEFFETVTADNAYQRLTPKLDIVYEDGNLLLLNKKPGVIVHQDKSYHFDSLVARVQHYLYEKGEYDPEADRRSRRRSSTASTATPAVS